MSILFAPKVTTLGLFEKRVEGDDCLMELARRRFEQAGMGTEMHASTPEQLDAVMKFRPSDGCPVVVHLPRDFNLADALCRERIREFATRFAGSIDGLVLHDHATMAARREDYVQAAWEMDARLEKIDRCPMLFVEYAVGLEPDDFARFFASIRDLDRISACIDIGHVGIRQARAAYAQTHPSEDICALKTQSARLPQVIAEVETAVRRGSAAVLDLVERIGPLGKPVHFHLHDAHPLSTFSSFGVSDHVSFETQIPLNFDYCGRRAVAPMFGPPGLSKLVARAFEVIRSGAISFTLEIHPTGERLPLVGAAPLFAHWTDKTNAEKMNHWLVTLTQNHELLRETIKAALPPEPREMVPEAPVPAASLSEGSEAAPRPPVEEALPVEASETVPEQPSEEALPAETSEAVPQQAVTETSLPKTSETGETPQLRRAVSRRRASALKETSPPEADDNPPGVQGEMGLI